MKTLMFKLSGETAFFKQPDVNTYLYYSYGSIHKVALMGMFGSILGLGGYNQQKKNDVYPEFYKQLNEMKIAICPLNDKGYIPKKVQVFNNSVGYASKEQGGNLIVREQWLEKPSWMIYVLLDDNLPILDLLSGRMINKSFVYLPYLGKNDHYANIESVEVQEVKTVFEEKAVKISSLFPKKMGELIPVKGLGKKEPDYKYEEQLPVLLEEKSNQYITEAMIYTNIPVRLKAEIPVFRNNEMNVVFF
jgi:CRISPR-associated protein Cas5h